MERIEIARIDTTGKTIVVSVQGDEEGKPCIVAMREGERLPIFATFDPDTAAELGRALEAASVRFESWHAEQAAAKKAAVKKPAPRKAGRR